MASFSSALGVLAALLALLGSALSADASADASQGWLAHMAQTSNGEDTLSELTATFFGAIPDALTSNAMKLKGSLLLNDLNTPGKRVAQRLQQLASMAGDVGGETGDCAAYTFTPGGAATNAKWTGPTLTLTQTTGSCVVTPAFSGAGNTRWTQLQSSLACLGPSTQWGWTPLTYEGPSVEPTVLEGPSCKFEYQFGSETVVKITGEEGKTKYPSEKEFYAAAVLDSVSDGDLLLLRTSLEQLDAGLASEWIKGLQSGNAGSSWKDLLELGRGVLVHPRKTIKDRTTSVGSLRGLGSRTLFGFRSG